jgi:hypothetical protein
MNFILEVYNPDKSGQPVAPSGLYSWATWAKDIEPGTIAIRYEVGKGIFGQSIAMTRQFIAELPWNEFAPTKYATYLETHSFPHIPVSVDELGFTPQRSGWPIAEEMALKLLQKF